MDPVPSPCEDPVRKLSRECRVGRQNAGQGVSLSHSRDRCCLDEIGSPALNTLRALRSDPGGRWHACSLVLFIFLAGTCAAIGDEAPTGVLGDRLWDTIDRGGAVMYVILALSIVGLGFVLDALFRTRRSAILPRTVESDLMEPAARDRAAEFAADDGKACVFDILRIGWRWRTATPEHQQRAIEEAVDVRLWRLKRSIRPIGIIANTAPLLGLLGTVVGIVQAFDAVAREGALGDPTALAGGIAKALLTTCFGLIVAIPMLVAYHYLGGRIEALLRQSEELVKELLIAPPDEPAENKIVNHERPQGLEQQSG